MLGIQNKIREIQKDHIPIRTQRKQTIEKIWKTI